VEGRTLDRVAARFISFHSSSRISNATCSNRSRCGENTPECRKRILISSPQSLFSLVSINCFPLSECVQQTLYLIVFWGLSAFNPRNTLRLAKESCIHLLSAWKRYVFSPIRPLGRT